MKEDFLRPPRTVVEWTADALRLIGVLGVVAAAVWLQVTDAGIAALALPALMLPRMLGMRAGFDVLSSVVVLAATWSNVFELYTAIRYWDLLMHFAGAGALAVIAALILDRCRIAAVTAPGVPARTPLVLLPLIALALSAVWEMIEWFGAEFVSPAIHVGYRDTIGDMMFGGLGGVVAGIVLTTVSVVRRAAPEDAAAEIARSAAAVHSSTEG
ncbi:hypothetical protein [Microbacterium sp. USHLN186]|uniref:hypothetical protein n=1 Tax=Microbacterium sp. USHLN186 TaxID=3081286 RepID=UPI00301661EB